MTKGAITITIIMVVESPRALLLHDDHRGREEPETELRLFTLPPVWRKSPDEISIHGLFAVVEGYNVKEVLGRLVPQHKKG